MFSTRLGVEQTRDLRLQYSNFRLQGIDGVVSLHSSSSTPLPFEKKKKKEDAYSSQLVGFRNIFLLMKSLSLVDKGMCERSLSVALAYLVSDETNMPRKYCLPNCLPYNVY